VIWGALLGLGVWLGLVAYASITAAQCQQLNVRQVLFDGGIVVVLSGFWGGVIQWATVVRL
jgi:hypothetical protein